MDEIDLEPILIRFASGWPREIHCDSGWFSIIVDIDRDLSEIDDSYQVHQIKEKFGRLCFYFEPSNPIFQKEMQDIVYRHMDVAARTCEVTGKPGSLMVSGAPFRAFKTLCSDYEELGWSVVAE